MRYLNSIFGNLLKPIDRRQFRQVVERHDGDAYDKSFKSWDHLVTLIGAQLGCIASLRGVEVAFNANSHQHYHLGVSTVARSTLSDANARRPVGIFADVFALLAQKADRHTRVEGAEMVRLIDSSPIPLGKMCKWAKWNGRIRGMKMHVVYHPGNDVPRCVELTESVINDVEVGRQTELEAGATYVFDKGYYHFGWWKKINDTKAFFVTRTKSNTRLRDKASLRAQAKGRRLQDHLRCQCRAHQQGRFQVADPAATHQGQTRQRPDNHSHHQRSQAHSGRDCGPLQEPLADRTAVPLDQAAPQYSQVYRQQQ